MKEQPIWCWSLSRFFPWVHRDGSTYPHPKHLLFEAVEETRPVGSLPTSTPRRPGIAPALGLHAESDGSCDWQTREGEPFVRRQQRVTRSRRSKNCTDRSCFRTVEV